MYNRCTTPIQLTDVHQDMGTRMFTRTWETICRERHFRTAPVWICTAPRSQTRTSPLRCVCTSCTKVGGPIAPCTTGVRLQDNSRMFNRPCQIICSERHFRKPPVRICTALLSRTETAHLSYVYTTCTKLEGPVEPCTTGLRLQDRSRMFTRPCQRICSERQFRTAPVRICKAPRGRTQQIN